MAREGCGADTQDTSRPGPSTQTSEIFMIRDVLSQSTLGTLTDLVDKAHGEVRTQQCHSQRLGCPGARVRPNAELTGMYPLSGKHVDAMPLTLSREV